MILHTVAQKKTARATRELCLKKLAESRWIEVSPGRWKNPDSGRIWNADMAIEIGKMRGDIREKGRNWRLTITSPKDKK